MKKKFAFNFSNSITLLVLFALLFSSAVQSAPSGGKGNKKGGGGGSGSGPQPELHFKWRVQLDGPYSMVRPAIADDGTVYAVDVTDNLIAVSPDGTVLWHVMDAGSKGVDVGPDGTIYTGNENWIKAFYPDGSLKWTFTQNPRAFVLIDVAVGPDGHVYAVASSGMGVFSLADSPSGPQLRWTNPEPYGRPFTGYTEIEFGPTADGQDQQLYFHANGHDRAVRLSDGASIFTVGGGNTIPRVSSFDGTWHRPATALDPDASLVWMYEFPPATGTTEPVLGQSGTHYAVNSGNVLHAIDPFGIQDWQTSLDEFTGSPDVDYDESFLLLPTGDTTTYPAALLAVSAANGSKLWRMEFPDDGSGLNQFIGSRAAFSSNGEAAYIMTAFAGGGRGYLNAIDTDPSAPSASTILRSAGINMSSKSRRGSLNVKGAVSVTDQNRKLISGATVLAIWSLPDGSTIEQSSTTSGSGTASFNVTGSDGLYRLTVTGITLEGYVFDPLHGVPEGSWYAF